MHARMKIRAVSRQKTPFRASTLFYTSPFNKQVVSIILQKHNHVIVPKKVQIIKIEPTDIKLGRPGSWFRSWPLDQGVIFGSYIVYSCIYNQNYPELELNVFGLAVSHHPNPTS